jgi:hypothetical protein
MKNYLSEFKYVLTLIILLILTFNLSSLNSQTIKNNLNIEEKENSSKVKKSNYGLIVEWLNIFDSYSNSHNIKNDSLNNNFFDKQGLSLYYDLLYNLQLGLKYKKGTFHIFNNFNAIDTFYLEKNLNYYLVAGRYNFNFARVHDFSVGIDSGYTQSGLIIIPNIGFNLYLHEEVYFSFNYDENYLFFNESNRSFVANKSSLVFGVGFKF